MLTINITLKSFQLSNIQKNISFLKEILLLLNKEKKTSTQKTSLQSFRLGQPNTGLQIGQSQMKNYFGKLKCYPKKKKLFTVLRGPHVDKKSREQFHFTTHTKKLSMVCKNLRMATVFLYILKNAELYGVEIQIAFSYDTVFLN